MPHKCTNCGRTFADGSKEMLSGCPDCGGNKFQFQPSGASPSPDEPKTPDSAGTRANASTTDDASKSSAVGRATNAVKGWVGSGNRSDSSNFDPNDRSGNRKSAKTERQERPSASRSKPTKKPAQTPASQAPADSTEDRAQASARSEIVPEDELPDRSDAEETGTVIKPPEDDQPSLDELREELNSQFESIKVVEPGQYELNLMELYERDEYIIAMRENGRYVIQVPDSWTGAADS